MTRVLVRADWHACADSKTLLRGGRYGIGEIWEIPRALGRRGKGKRD